MPQPWHNVNDFRADVPPYNGSRENYDRARQKRYPGLTKANNIPEAAPFHARYTQFKQENDFARDQYIRKEEEERKTIKDRPLNERRYYQETSGSILPTGHLALQGLANTVGDGELAHARARGEALHQHRHMYGSIGNAQKHYKYVEEHFAESKKMYELRDGHRRKASASPPAAARDIYGNEPTEGHLPNTNPYPPDFPGPGRYSAAAGEEAYSAEMTDGFETVGTRRGGPRRGLGGQPVGRRPRA